MVDGAVGRSDDEILDVDVEHQPGAATALVRVAGDVDALTAGDLTAVLERVVAAGATDLHLDLDAVPFLDSTGLSAVIAVHTQLGGRGTVTIERASSSVRRTFEVAGLELFLGAP